jgi:hypothetical protein
MMSMSCLEESVWSQSAYSVLCYKSSGQPALQFGSMPSRKEVENASGGSIIQLPLKASLNHIKQWAVYLGQACHLDFQRERQLADALQSLEHSVSFFKVTDKVILVGLQFNPDAPFDDRYQLPNGSRCTIKWKRDGRQTEFESYSAQIVDNVFNIDPKYTVLLASPSSAAMLQELSVPVGQKPNARYPATLKLFIADGPVKKRLQVINAMLTVPLLSKWHAAILAQEPDKLPVVQTVDWDLDKVNIAWDRLINKPGLKFNDDQFRGPELSA